MKKFILLLLLLTTTSLSAKWSYYLIDLTRLSDANFILIKNKLNELTENRFDRLFYYTLNNTTLKTSTRIIVECDDKIEQFNLVQKGLAVGVVQKIMTSEYVVENGVTSSKLTVLKNYLKSPTSWYSVVEERIK